MKRTIPSLAFAILTISSVLTAGCGDVVFSESMPGDSFSSESDLELSKLRHKHLLRAKFLSRTKVLERYAELAASNDFVVGVTPTTQSLSRVIERYSVLDSVTVTRSYRKVINGFAVHVENPEAFLQLVELDGDILWVEPDMRVKNTQPKKSNLKSGSRQFMPWGVDRLGVNFGSIGDAGVDADIFVLDGGLAWMDLNEAADVDIVGTGSGNGASAAHGTHVAGTAAAQDNSYGVVGVAPGARVHSYKVLNGSGTAQMSDVIEAVDQITEIKLADPSRPIVVNISFGSDIGTTDYTSLDEAIEASIAAGVTYVIAAGNEGIDASTVTPAHVAGAITVGAYDAQDSFASFSNYGPTVDLLAPGVDIESLGPTNRRSAPPVYMSGTSMAAPHVTGVAALYLDAHPSATPAEVRAALVGAGKSGINGTPANTTAMSVHVGSWFTTLTRTEITVESDDNLTAGSDTGNGSAKGRRKGKGNGRK